jgi:hypothetical protein
MRLPLFLLRSIGCVKCSKSSRRGYRWKPQWLTFDALERKGGVTPGRYSAEACARSRPRRDGPNVVRTRTFADLAAAARVSPRNSRKSRMNRYAARLVGMTVNEIQDRCRRALGQPSGFAFIGRSVRSRQAAPARGSLWLKAIIYHRRASIKQVALSPVFDRVMLFTMFGMRRARPNVARLVALGGRWGGVEPGGAGSVRWPAWARLRYWLWA